MDPQDWEDSPFEASLLFLSFLRALDAQPSDSPLKEDRRNLTYMLSRHLDRSLARVPSHDLTLSVSGELELLNVSSARERVLLSDASLKEQIGSDSVSEREELSVKLIVDRKRESKRKRKKT